MSRIEQNYKTSGLLILLNEECAPNRYWSLIPYKQQLVNSLIEGGCPTKHECALLTDGELMAAGLPNEAAVSLLRRFLTLYDITSDKLKLFDAAAVSPEERVAYAELLRLPGVRLTRAELYYRAGYTSLKKVAAALCKELIVASQKAIERDCLSCTPPLQKEAATHIAVAKVLTEFV